MLRRLLVLIILSATGLVQIQAQRIDSVAVYVLQQTAATIANMQSCRFTTYASYDVWNNELGYIKNNLTEKVSMSFPDQMAINATGDKGHKAILYDGRQFTLYSYSNNQYAQVDISGSIVQAIDTLHKSYHIEFPGADFFYPSFVSDILTTGSNLIYLGIIEVEGKPCFHIAGKDEAGTGFQFWISNDDLFLPVRMVVIYKTANGYPQFQATYADWLINPVNPPSLFDFSTPPGAKKVKLHSTNLTR